MHSQLVCSSFLKNNGECQHDNNVNPFFILPRATKLEKRALRLSCMITTIVFIDTWAKIGTRILFVFTYRKANVKPIAQYRSRCSGSPWAIAKISELIRPAKKKFRRLYNAPKMTFRNTISSRIGPIMDVTIIMRGAVFISRQFVLYFLI